MAGMLAQVGAHVTPDDVADEVERLIAENRRLNESLAELQVFFDERGAMVERLYEHNNALVDRMLDAQRILFGCR